MNMVLIGPEEIPLNVDSNNYDDSPRNYGNHSQGDVSPTYANFDILKGIYY